MSYVVVHGIAALYILIQRHHPVPRHEHRSTPEV
jgi:hypothetical protein